MTVRRDAIPPPSESAGAPPDPAAYDSPRAVQARRKGLPASYIAGGADPELEATRQRERRYLWLLIAMIVVIVLSGFVLGFLASILGG